MHGKWSVKGRRTLRGRDSSSSVNNLGKTSRNEQDSRPLIPRDCLLLLGALGLLAAQPLSALAHVGGHAPHPSGGFLSGFTHPLFGIDHIVAMVAVGLWGAQLGRPAVWLLPVTFPLVMAFGGVLGMRGVEIPFVEVGIALSAVALGIMVALAARPPLWVAAVIVGAFAIFHGHAHGTELPAAAAPLAYGAGFVIATGLLHAAGILIGVLSSWPLGERFVRVAGGGIACAGVVFLAIQCGAA